MRVYQITQFGIEHLTAREVPQPTCGPGQVLVRVRATSLNYRDLMMVRGQYDRKLDFPRIPLSDGAGEVVETGAGVTTVKTGDRVIGLFSQNWLDGEPSAEKARHALGGDVDGMLAEYVALPEHGVLRFPVYLSDAEAATLPCAALTAWNALFESSRTRPGTSVLIQGTGGVSIFALQFAKLAGARVLGTSGSDAKLEAARKLGLDEGLNYRQTPEWSRWVKERTAGAGADTIIEVGGAGTFGESLKAVRMGGIIVQIGVLSGIEERLPLVQILMRQIQVKGINVGSRAMAERMMTALAQSKLRPVIDRVFPFDEPREALQYMASGNHMGKVVLQIGEK